MQSQESIDLERERDYERLRQAEIQKFLEKCNQPKNNRISEDSSLPQEGFCMFCGTEQPGRRYLPRETYPRGKRWGPYQLCPERTIIHCCCGAVSIHKAGDERWMKAKRKDFRS